MKVFRPLLAPAAVLALAGCQTLPATQSPAVDIGVVQAADPRAAEAGREMLRRGGSATDAAIAVMLALTVVEPQSSGIGGGGFMVRGEADGTVTTYDGRETAPSAAGPEWFFGEDGEPQTYAEVVLTGLSVGVPGNIALAAKAHAEHGRLPWAELFEPAIALAEGFVMNPRLNDSLDGSIERAGQDPLMRRTFYTQAGEPRPIGTVISRPELAETFRRLAAEGPEAMYAGEDAEALAGHIAANTPRDAAMRAQDITSYEAKERDAVCGTYRAYRICSMGPPTSGGIALLQMLGQLERFDIAALGPQSVEFWHLFTQSQLLAYADRERYTGDSDFVSVPVRELTDPDYLSTRSALIDPARTLGSYQAGDPVGLLALRPDGDEPQEHGTTHFVAVDREGAMVSYTSTVEGGFGSGLQFGGYYLNNELTDFSFSPERDGVPVANRVEGGKRPRSSMSPAIVWDPAGEPFLVIGGAGGPFIPVQTARSIIGIVDFDMALEEAFSLPIVMGFGPNLFVEADTWLASQEDALAALGYENIRTGPQPFGSVGQVGAINRGGEWSGAYDPRFRGRLEAAALED
ncbi:gamma-glutamyltransferase family protein [Aurantiacibacter poecillastricola]|uniref:gamma-glutamyltransferase family protein n=1 Tax=Aurantiacibacter poecillastricola TaxID=3064385 RepID=UPI00273D8024|nr:gamma-glutamyltransferase family protein [Aurantiacibacter sp. 219JJ12-13]MDP5260541.1 gamma-glutamyltransferase family protein [Aurantiacibacter sp. 219JJ12-13]